MNTEVLIVIHKDNNETIYRVLSKDLIDLILKLSEDCTACQLMEKKE